MYSWLLQLLERVFYRPLSPSCTLALFKCWRRVWAVAIASQPENGDGKITRKELSDSLEKLNIHVPEKELIQMIEKIDVNGDGHVDMEEFGALYEALLDERGIGGDEEDMREAFNVFDQNGDGFITVEELRSVLVAMGLKQGRTVDDCKNMIAKVDVDGDGMVNYDEFRKMMKGGGFAASSPSD